MIEWGLVGAYVSSWSDLDLETSLNPKALLDVELMSPKFLIVLMGVVNTLHIKLGESDKRVYLSFLEQGYLEILSRYLDEKYPMLNIYSVESVLSHFNDIRDELKIISMMYYCELQKVG